MPAATSLEPFYRSLPLSIQKLSAAATIPRRGSQYAAGLDLSAAEELVIPAGGRAVVKTDLAIAVPPGTYGRVAPRSGLAVKHGIDVGAGVIDADYRGNVGVVLMNLGANNFTVSVGDRIAQLVLEQIIVPDIVECDELPALGDRGAAGYGSTGVAAADESSAKKMRTISPSTSNDNAIAKDDDMKEAN